jgi:MFS family permease
MLLFGWRLVFLLSIVSASLAFVLRLHMPEPEEFLDEREEAIFPNLQRIAARRSTSSAIGTRRHSTGGAMASYSASAIQNGDASANGGLKYLGLRVTCSLQLARDQQLKEQQQQQQEESDDTYRRQDTVVSGVELCSGMPKSDERSCADDSAIDTTPSAPAAAAAAASGDATIAIADTDNFDDKQGEYVPAVRLLRKHWLGVLLQFLFEAWVSIGFWVISTWLPLQLRAAPVFLPEKITQAMLIVNLTVMGAVQLAAGWASDRGMPRVWSCFAVFTLAAGISVPVFIGFARASAAGCWLLHLLLMVLMGWVLGLVPGEGLVINVHMLINFVCSD